MDWTLDWIMDRTESNLLRKNSKLLISAYSHNSSEKHLISVGLRLLEIRQNASYEIPKSTIQRAFSMQNMIQLIRGILSHSVVKYRFNWLSRNFECNNKFESDSPNYCLNMNHCSLKNTSCKFAKEQTNICAGWPCIFPIDYQTRNKNIEASC